MENDRADFAALRRDVYQLLAGFLSEAPTQEMIDALLCDAGVLLFTPFNDDGLVDRLRAAARECPLDELRQEFWDLFVVPTPRFVAPSQSVYLDVREVAGEVVGSLTMGDSAVAVTRAYAEVGLERGDARPVPPDHVAIELSFMSRLCEDERVGWKRGASKDADLARDRARRFLARHLCRWLPALREKVERNAEKQFYPLLLELVCMFIGADRQELAEDETATTA